MAAKSSSIVYAYAVQVDQNTTATGTYQSLTTRSGGFSSSGDEADTGASANRHKEASTLGSITHSASFEYDFSPDIHDDFLQSAFSGVWTDNGAGEDELVVASTPVYFTFVVYAPYLAANQYTIYTGCQVSTAGFTFPKDNGGVIGLSTDLGVANRTYQNTAPWTTLNAAVTSKLKTCDVLSVLADDVAIPSVIDQLDWSITSDSESVFDIRQCDAVEVLLDDASTSGTMVMLHDDASDQWHRDAESATEFKLEMQINTPTTDYRIVLSRAVNRATGPDYTNDNVSVSVPFGSIVSPSIFRTQ